MGLQAAEVQRASCPDLAEKQGSDLKAGRCLFREEIPHLRGFKNNRKIIFNVINLGMLEDFKEGSTIDY